MEDILQWVAVAILLAIAVIYIVRRIKRKGGSGCSDCGLSDCCTSRKCDTDDKPSKKRS